MNNQIMEINDIVEKDTEHLFSESNTDYAQFLSFELADEIYCVDILTVCEIRGWQTPTLLPNSPKHIKGVINIRGDVIPVIDLREKFHLGTIEYTKQTVVIVLKVNSKKNTKTIGIVVDSVSDVVHFDMKNIKEAPEYSENVDANYIDGLFDLGKEVVVVLDVDKLLDLSDVEAFYSSLVRSN